MGKAPATGEVTTQVLFSILDEDNDGFLTEKVFTKMMTTSGLSEDEVAQTFRQAAPDGTMTFEQFEKRLTAAGMIAKMANRERKEEAEKKTEQRKSLYFR